MEIPELELQHFVIRLPFIQEVERLNLLEHFFLHDLAPGQTHVLQPFSGHGSELEQLGGGEEGEDLGLEDGLGDVRNRQFHI